MKRPIEQFTIDFERPVWPTVEMLERAREEFTDENLCIAWAASGDRSWWESLPKYQQHVWLQRYINERESTEETRWRNARRMWSCGCVLGYGRRLKHRGLNCERCGEEVRIRRQPGEGRMRAPGLVLMAEEENYQIKKGMAERLAVEIREAFKKRQPCPFTPAPGFEWLLDWAFEIASVPRECFAS